MNKRKTIICCLIDWMLISIVGMILLNGPTVTTEKSSTLSSEKYLPSRYLTYETKEEVQEEMVTEENVIEESLSENQVTKEILPDEQIQLPEETKDQLEKDSTSSLDVIETLIGKLSGYGPDCYGCTTNRTASGYYVGDGNIYYQDPTFGKVRILAGDSKYPFHTIVRITNSNIADEIIGIVLDRGSAIGIGEKYLFDLLYQTEKEASAFGVNQNVTFEILRLGN